MQRFFKEPVDAYCTYTVHVRNIAKQFGAAFAAWNEKERSKLTEALWESGKFEEGAVAIQLYARMRRKCGIREWKIFTRWLEKYVRNWAHCDGVSSWLLAACIANRPELRHQLVAWTSSPNRWKRRSHCSASNRRRGCQEMPRLSSLSRRSTERLPSAQVFR